jgi:3'(2'), 5'-bisphosphate nucleotidase
MPYEREKEVAIAAARIAASLCEQVRQGITPTAIEKRDRSPVTVADFGSQAIICRLLSEAFPQDPIVAEEDAAVLRQPDMVENLAQVVTVVQNSMPDATPDQVLDWIDRGNGSVGKRFWTLDPIDGTKGFLRGDQYAVAIALIEAGQVKLGVLACPAFAPEMSPVGTTGALLVAVRGQGAMMLPLQGGDAYPIQVASSEHSSSLRFVEGVEATHSDHSQQEAIAKATGITAPSLRIDSQAKYGVVACGQATLYLRLPSPKTPHYREKIWDHAAGSILVQEAGGQVTDISGTPLDFTLGAELAANRGVIVSNGASHQAVLTALREQSGINIG